MIVRLFWLLFRFVLFWGLSIFELLIGLSSFLSEGIGERLVRRFLPGLFIGEDVGITRGSKTKLLVLVVSCLGIY